MARAVESGARGPSSSPGWGHCVGFFSSQVHKWVPANLMLGGNPAMD